LDGIPDDTEYEENLNPLLAKHGFAEKGAGDHYGK
jgi:hypothetical protein